MLTANQTLTLALAEVGVKESPAYSNIVKYWDEVAPGYQGQPWCAGFCAAILKAAGVDYTPIKQNTFSCTSLMKWAKSNGKYIEKTDVIPGDLLFFDFDNNPSVSEHIGFCESVSGTAYKTIEGNTSSTVAGDQSDGGCVARRTRAASVVIGAYRPTYASETPAVPEPEPDLPADTNEPSAWAKAAWDWAIKNGITYGTEPQEYATREQVALMLYRYFGLYGEAALDMLNIMAYDPNVNIVDPPDPIDPDTPEETMADAAEMLKNGIEIIVHKLIHSKITKK